MANPPTAALKIIADGEFTVTKPGGNEATAYKTSGSFGGGTLTFGYRDADGNFAAYTTDAVYTAANQFVMEHGIEAETMVDLTGATAPDISILASAFYH